MAKQIAFCFCALLIVITACCFGTHLVRQADAVDLPLNNGLYIIIDAGHGGMDSGTSAADGTREKDLNLLIAKKLDALFSAAGYKTVMLRQDDELIGDNSISTIRGRKVSDIKKRLAIAQSYPQSLLVSIHQNYYPVEKYSGAQIFYSPNAPESKLLAQSVQDAVKNNLQPDNNRQIKETGTNIYLLYNCAIPSIMVECGFLSNEQETQKLKDSEYQKQLAFAVFNGIINYLE